MQNTRLATPISSGSKEKVEKLMMANRNRQTQSNCTASPECPKCISEEVKEVVEVEAEVEQEEEEEEHLICAGDQHQRRSASSGFASADLYIHLYPLFSNLN